MRRSIVCQLVMLGSVVLFIASPASAQTDKKLGLVIAHPATAGVQWQINDRLAIRGDAAFDWGRTDQVSTVSFSLGGAGSSTTTTRSHHSTAAIGVSGLITVARRDQLRFYVVPRVAWRPLRTEFESETVTTGLPTRPSSVPEGAPSLSLSSNAVEFSGSFGAAYRLGDRCSIFGEAGISYQSPTAASSSAAILRSYSVGSRSGVGIVIHF